ncbi:MAG: translocation/assembly module TamB domain-containing protein [Blastocatellia bacterium]
MRPRRLKRLVFAIAAATLIVGTLAFAVWLYVRSENFNKYVAREIESEIREFGLRAEIGNFGISWNTQTARLRDLKIYNERTGQIVATIERLDTRVEVSAPLALESRREIAIKKVEVEGVDFYYEIDQQGRTNLDGVRYAAPKSEASDFDTTRMIATFAGGAIHFKDLSRRIEADIQEAQGAAQPQPQNSNVVNLRFESALGRVSYAGHENRFGKFDLRARVSKDGVEVEGLSLESNAAQVKAKGRIEDWAAPRYGFDFNSRVKLDETSRILGLNRSLNGEAEVNGRIDGEGANYTFKGAANCAEASVANIKLSDARIPFSGAGKGDRIAFASDQIRARSATAQLTAADAVRLGSIVINDLKGDMAGGETIITAPKVSVAAIEWPRSKLDNLSLNNVAAKINSANYKVNASATLVRGEIRGVSVTGASAHAAFDNAALILSDIKGALFGGTVAGEYVLPLAPGATQRAKASFADIETKQVTAILGSLSDKGELPISGKITGEVDLSFADRHPRSLNGRVAAHFEGQSDEASEAIPITGDVDVTVAGGVFNFDQLKLAASGSTLIGGGSLSADGNSDLRVSLDSTSAERLIQIARGFEIARSYIERYEPQIIGDFKLEGRVTGPIEKASIEADVKAGMFGLRDAILGSLAGHIFISSSEARVENGVITTSNGESVKFDFAAPLDQNANTGRLDATLDRMNLEMILAASGSPSANQFITGAVSGEVHLTGLPAKPLGSAKLNLVNGRVADREAQLATASVKFEGKNATLELLEIQTSPQRLTASGSMNLDDYSFKVGGKAERISLANLAEAFELKETQVEGGADADFQVGGKVVTGKQIDLDWENLKLELTARGRGVKINGRDAGELKLTANTSAGGRLDAQLFTGILAANGKSHVGRKPDLIKASVELRAPGRPITIESNLANVDIAPFVDALAPELNSHLKGAVTGSLRIEGPSLDEKGSPTFDRLRGALTLMDVALLVADNQVKVETPTMITLEGSRIKFPKMRVTGEGADLNFGGTLAYGDQAAMNFSLAGGVNLDRLPALADGLVLFGSVEIDASLTGTFDDPKTHGKVDVNGFGLSMSESPIFISKGTGRFTLAGDHITLETFTADANDGRIEAGGAVNLDKLRPKEWRYDIKIEDAVIAYQEITATINGDLTLAGTPEGQKLVGQIAIPQAEYKPSVDIDNVALGNGATLSFGSFSGPSATQLKIPAIEMDVRVEARDSLIIQNDQINTVGSAILTLTGPITNPDTSGPITLDGGTWRLRGHRCEIISGSLEFPPGGSTPLLNMQAEGNYTGYRVTIGLSGPVDKPKLTLRSEPQLTDNEILALITTGRAEAGTVIHRDPSVGASVGAAASLLSSGLISRPTEQLLGLSRFQIDPVIGPNANPAARLTVGQQFSRNLYFSYSTNLDLGSAQQRTALGEYTLSNRFSALAAYTQGGSAAQGRSEESAFTIELRGRQRFSLGFNPERISAPGASADSLTRIVRPKLPQAQVKVSEIQNFKLGQNKMRELLPVMTQGFSRSLMRLGERRLKEHLQEAGYFFAEVKARCEPENCAGEKLRVFYDVEPGAIYDLKEIRIEGTDLIKLKDIAEELQSQPASAAGDVPFLKSLPLVGGYARGLTSGDRLNSDEEMIRRKLVDIGYRAARVKSRLAFKPDNDDLIVIFNVSPGDQSKIADVNPRGNVIAQTSELMAVVPVGPDAVFSYSRAQLGAQRIKQLYAERGFLEATVTPEFIELGGERVRLVYNINEGSRAVISEIEINGTTKTGDGWVRRFLAFKQGDVLTPEKIRQTQRDLYATNAFREVSILTEPLAGGAGTAHKVLINLTEAKPLLFVYGMGLDYSHSTKVVSPRGSVEITSPNLGGSLNSLSLRGRASQLEKFAQLSFTDLRPFSWRLPTTFSVFYNRNDNLRAFLRRRFSDGSEDSGASFRVERYGAFIQTERKLGERTSMRFRYNLEHAEVLTAKDGVILESVVTRNEQLIKLGMFSAGFSRDTRDSAINPTRGQLFSADHSIAARIFGGTESFNKFFATYQRYKTLDQFTPLLGNSTLAFSARIGLASTFNAPDRDGNGVIDASDRRLPISERFFSGGATTLRGFRFETAGPQAVVEPRPDSPDNCDNPLRPPNTACAFPTLVPLGGDALAVFNFELRYPLTSRLRLVPFYDLGNVFKSVSDFRFSRMTNTIGVGMRINTPLGPLGVDYGYLIDPPAFSTSSGALLRQPRGAIHIRFGQTF